MNPAKEQLQRVTEGQKALMKQLAKQHQLMVTQLADTCQVVHDVLMTQDTKEMKTWMQGPTPIKLQKMGLNNDPAAFLSTFAMLKLLIFTLYLSHCHKG